MRPCWRSIVMESYPCSAMISAVNAFGIESQPFSTGLLSAQSDLILFAFISSPNDLHLAWSARRVADLWCRRSSSTIQSAAGSFAPSREVDVGLLVGGRIEAEDGTSLQDLLGHEVLE